MQTRRAVVLMNLGSPASSQVADVKQYLLEFLMDERVIDLPYWRRWLLVKGIIAPFRAPKSAKAYSSIWTTEGSPLLVITRQLQQALQPLIPDPVVIAMRYGSPSPAEAFDELVKHYPTLEEVLVIPLYPHYAMSSYETAVEYARTCHASRPYPFRMHIIKPFYQEVHYIEALAESIRPYLQTEFDHLLFSYHGVPVRHILKGDITHRHCLKNDSCCQTASATHAYCYRHQCLSTTRLVTEKLGLAESRYSVSFQSRLGRDPWLEPYTARRLAELPAQGFKKIAVVCPAFVSDCLETLEEIAAEGKEIFLHAGGEQFTMIPCLNTHPDWVKTLVGYIADAHSPHPSMLL